MKLLKAAFQWSTMAAQSGSLEPTARNAYVPPAKAFPDSCTVSAFFGIS